MTIITVLNGVNLGGNSTLTNSNATKVTLQTGTTALVLNAQISAWNEQQGQTTRRQTIRIYYAVSPFSVAAGSAPATFQLQVGMLDIIPLPSGITCDTTGVIFNNGGYLYVWFDSPPMAPNGNVPPTLTLTSVEQP